MAPDLPIACSLDGRALASRQSELRAGVLGEADSVERLVDGYRWRFTSGRDLLARLGAVIDAERQCCRFLRFAIGVEPDMSAVTVEVTGPPGSADFLESWTVSNP